MKWLQENFLFQSFLSSKFSLLYGQGTQKSQMCIHIFYEMKSLHKNLLFQCVGTHCRHFMVTICFFLLPGVSSDTTNIQNSVAQKLSFGWRILLYLKLKANIFNNFSSCAFTAVNATDIAQRPTKTFTIHQQTVQIHVNGTTKHKQNT